MKKTNKRGFTLIELMIVVAIIGILAAVAIPAFINYMKRAKTSEATLNLKSIAEGAISYHDTHGSQMPDAAAIIPTGSSPSEVPQELNKTVDDAFTASNGWQQIGWKPHKAYLYRYEFTKADSTTIGVLANATAYGDLDGDGTNSTFNRPLNRLESGMVKIDDLTIDKELE